MQTRQKAKTSSAHSWKLMGLGFRQNSYTIEAGSSVPVIQFL